MSPSDELATAQAKMKEYLINGVTLGWLINRRQQQAEIYRLGRDVEVLSAPKRLAGESVLPGFELDLGIVW